MADYVPELKVLSEILLNGKNIREAMFMADMEEKISLVGKKRLQENVQGVLRHYFCLSFECQMLSVDPVNSQEHILLLVALYELRYHKDKPVVEIRDEYLSAFSKLRLLGDPEKNFQTLHEASKKDFQLPDDVKGSPYLYNSLVLEFPEFLLRRLHDEYSSERALAIACKAHKRPKCFYAPSLNGEIHKSDVNLDVVTFDDESFIYESKKPLSVKEMKKMGLYPIGYVEALAYSKVRIPSLMPKVLLTGLDDGFDFLPIAFASERFYQSELVATYDDDMSYRSGVDAIRFFGLKKAKALHSSLKLLKTFVPFDHFDIVIDHASDMNIGKTRTDKSILPSLKEEMIEKSKMRQIDELIEDARFVKEGGYLLFLNHSLIKEETVDVIESFLLSRKDFLKIESEVVFPDKIDSDGGYYCLMKRKVRKND